MKKFSKHFDDKKHCKKWFLSRRMQNYNIKNGHRSPITSLEFNFLKSLYWYLTKQHQSTSLEFKKDLYTSYVDIVNLSYKFNRSDPDPNMQETIHLQMKIILDNETKGPRSFILLNNEFHIERMNVVLELLYRWFTNPNYYGYASENEFWTAMEFLRSRFEKIDLEDAVGKFPRKFRERFNRE